MQPCFFVALPFFTVTAQTNQDELQFMQSLCGMKSAISLESSSNSVRNRPTLSVACMMNMRQRESSDLIRIEILEEVYTTKKQ
jgi:hypothetical protein